MPSLQAYEQLRSKKIFPASILGRALLVVGSSLALWLAAKVQIPFYPVPMTLQSLVVLAIGMCFGLRLGAATVALYLLEGALGLPVFSGTPERGLGLAYMAGPTGGYLLGYLLAAATAGALADRGWAVNMPKAFTTMLVGTLAIYVPGLLWLGFMIGWDRPVLSLGLMPFIAGDALKIAIGGLAVPTALGLIRPR